LESELIDYYRRRAGEYESIYAKPERQVDLALLKKKIPARCVDAHVLEIACGTGYWTSLIARRAFVVVATDLAEEPMRIAQSKTYEGRNVFFKTADAYALPVPLGWFDVAFAGFWWSHVPRQRIGEFLGSLHARLAPGARVLLLDNRYVEGNSSPIVDTDADGNTYQDRRLADDSVSRIVKNFPSRKELRALLGPSLAYEELEYYWLAEYRR